MKRKIKEKVLELWGNKEKILITTLLMARIGTAMTVQASGVINTGVPELDKLLNTIVMILGGVVSVIGLIKLINGIRAWSDANEEMDAARKSQGMNSIISGAVCALVLPIMAILGYAIR